MAESSPCGSCTMCCKLLDIPVLDKPQGLWCSHCAVGQGCTIYDSRPAPCRDFVCLWLELQGSPRPMPPELRPDKSKLVLYYVDDWRDVIGLVDSGAPDAWKARPVQALLQTLSKSGRRVMFGNGREHFAMDRGRARRVELAPPDAAGVRKFVRFLD